MSRDSSQDSELSGSAMKPSTLEAVKYCVAMASVCRTGRMARSRTSERSGGGPLRRTRDVARHAVEDHPVERCDRPPVEVTGETTRVKQRTLSVRRAVPAALHPQLEPGGARQAHL